MLFNEKEKEIVKKAISDYDFMREEIENKINKNYTLEDLSNFILRFTNVTISNLEEEKTYGYLDFYYNDVSMFVGYDYNSKNHKIHVGDTFEIYNKEKEEYIIEDFCTKKEYQDYLENTKEKELQTRINKLKYLEEKELKVDYNAQKEYIIDFLKKYW